MAVHWHLHRGLPYRDVEELPAECGIDVDQVKVYRGVQQFSQLLADAARFARHSPGDQWFVDDTYVWPRRWCRANEDPARRAGRHRPSRPGGDGLWSERRKFR